MKLNDANLLEGPSFTSQHSVLEELLAAVPNATDAPLAGIPAAAAAIFARIGRVVGFSSAGLPLVFFLGNPGPQAAPAKSTCAIAEADLGREVVIVFEEGDLAKPIVLGLVQPATPLRSTQSEPQPVQVELDGEQVTLSAKKRIVLRCGAASITLTSSGKVLIQGAYLSSHASGLHRIKGASVQIN